jgi:hypothetical protein
MGRCRSSMSARLVFGGMARSPRAPAVSVSRKTPPLEIVRLEQRSARSSVVFLIAVCQSLWCSLIGGITSLPDFEPSDRASRFA